MHRSPTFDLLIARVHQPLLLHLFRDKLLDSLALRSQPSSGAELEDLGPFLRLEVVRSRPEAHFPGAANLNGPVKVNDLHRALQNVSPVFNPAQIVLQSLSLQNICEVSTRGEDVAGALHAAPYLIPNFEARGVPGDEVVYGSHVCQFLVHISSPFFLPHRTGGDGDSFKSRPGRLDKPGYSPTPIGYGRLKGSKPKVVPFYFLFPV